MFDKMELDVWGNVREGLVHVSSLNRLLLVNYGKGPVFGLEMHQTMVSKEHEWYEVRAGFTNK